MIYCLGYHLLFIPLYCSYHNILFISISINLYTLLHFFQAVCQVQEKFPVRQWGSSLLGLRKRDPLLSPHQRSWKGVHNIFGVLLSPFLVIKSTLKRYRSLAKPFSYFQKKHKKKFKKRAHGARWESLISWDTEQQGNTPPDIHIKLWNNSNIKWQMCDADDIYSPSFTPTEDIYHPHSPLQKTYIYPHSPLQKTYIYPCYRHIYTPAEATYSFL